MMGFRCKNVDKPPYSKLFVNQVVSQGFFSSDKRDLEAKRIEIFKTIMDTMDFRFPDLYRFRI